MPSNAPLLDNNQKVLLYDATSMLNTNAQQAQGMVVILGGATPESAKKTSKEEKEAVNLGFLALTEGNVVDACFGVKVQGARKEETSGSKQAKRVKELLAHAADSKDSIRRVAVSTYRQAFVEVVNFQAEVAKLNFFTACFKYGKLQHASEMRLTEIFENLQEAMAQA